nr:hypothetical protein [Azospirillum palustre]
MDSVVMPLPTLSLLELPTRLLDAETTPVTPAVPFPQDAAPADAAAPFAQ